MSDETEIERLRARIRELEAQLALAHGTLRFQSLHLHDEPTRYTHNVPPTAPPHDILAERERSETLPSKENDHG